jgi:hypothetical protein
MQMSTSIIVAEPGGLLQVIVRVFSTSELTLMRTAPHQ